MNTGRDETPAERFYREKAPLADRMRPVKIAEFLGQEHLMGADRAFRQAVEHDRIASMIFWGPPGTGKTTLGRLIARITGRKFIHRSAVTSGVKAKYDALIADGLTPTKRWGEPADIARAIGAIADGKLDFSTGQVINVDGGFHLRRL